MYELIKPTFWQHIFGAGKDKLVTDQEYEYLSERKKRRYRQIPAFPTTVFSATRRPVSGDFYTSPGRREEEAPSRSYESDNSYTPPVFPTMDFDSGPSYRDNYEPPSNNDNGGGFDGFRGGDGGGGGASADY